MPRTSKSSGRVCKQSVARVATVLKGRPYKLGGDGSNSSADFDCFGMMVVYYRLRYGAEVLRIDPKTYNPMEKYWECENHETIMVLFKKFM
ncbi:MAG: C40 family peptidase, partial [Candidatus Peribacteraceae bacterium]|nr:C40 family peptidase [Candidatus Peribacteraceae bacterium]